MSVYEEAIKDKNLAAKILIPLIECEGRVMSTSTISIIQSEDNVEFLKKIYEICKTHGWMKKDRRIGKGHKKIYNQNVFHTYKGEKRNFKAKAFNISPIGFKEIYLLAGPFVSKNKDNYAKILCCSAGTLGGGVKINENNLLKLIKGDNKIKVSELQISIFNNFGKSLTYGSLCRRLNSLVKRGKLKREKIGRAYFYSIN